MPEDADSFLIYYLIDIIFLLIYSYNYSSLLVLLYFFTFLRDAFTFKLILRALTCLFLFNRNLYVLINSI